MIYFYDTCSLLNNSKEIFASKQKFIISSITINELENIKTSDKKDAETKYQARVLLRLLDKYDYLYEIATYKRRYNWILRKFSLPATNDSQIIATAYYFNKHKYKEEIIFNTNDLSCRQIASLEQRAEELPLNREKVLKKINNMTAQNSDKDN